MITLPSPADVRCKPSARNPYTSTGTTSTVMLMGMVLGMASNLKIAETVTMTIVDSYIDDVLQ